MREGPLAALDAIEQATGEREVNAIGYCLGGTLLAATLAYMAAKGDDRIKTATFFVTMIDFEEAGELSRVHRRGAADLARREHEASAAISKAARWRRPSTCCAPTI